MNKISVIVPIYNTSLYLEECINSIVNQTYTNIEIILINDGSTDRSLEICHKLSKCDKRIKVLDKEHTGIADSRNVGLNNASGEFISFIDSDDYISSDMYENMIRYMEKYDLDIAECSMNIVNDELENNDFSELNEPNGIVMYNNIEGIKEFLLKKIQPSCCNKLFRRSLIGNSIFYPINRLEEYCFSWEMIKKSKKYIFLPNRYYNYRYLRNFSITKSDENRSVMNYVEFSKCLEHHILFYFPQLIKEAQYYTYTTGINTLKILSRDLFLNHSKSHVMQTKHFIKYLLELKNQYTNIDNEYIKKIQEGEAICC